MKESGLKWDETRLTQVDFLNDLALLPIPEGERPSIPEQKSDESLCDSWLLKCGHRSHKFRKMWSYSFILFLDICGVESIDKSQR